MSWIRAACLQQLALLMALFSVGGQLAGAVHLLLVPHVVCPEHGELIHLDGDGESEHPAPLDLAASAYRRGSETTAADAHDHCMVSAIRGAEPTLREPCGTLVAACISAPLASGVPAPALHQAVPLLLLAPKSSPPILLG
jgi:hypothetical protein